MSSDDSLDYSLLLPENHPATVAAVRGTMVGDAPPSAAVASPTKKRKPVKARSIAQIFGQHGKRKAPDVDVDKHPRPKANKDAAASVPKVREPTGKGVQTGAVNGCPEESTSNRGADIESGPKVRERRGGTHAGITRTSCIAERRCGENRQTRARRRRSTREPGAQCFAQA